MEAEVVVRTQTIVFLYPLGRLLHVHLILITCHTLTACTLINNMIYTASIQLYVIFFISLFTMHPICACGIMHKYVYDRGTHCNTSVFMRV